MRQEHVVELGQKPRRGRHIRIGEPAVDYVEEFSTPYVGEGPQLRCQGSQDVVDRRQTGPGADVAGRGWAERAQVSQHNRVGIGCAVQGPSEPPFDGRQSDLTAVPPQAARRDLYQRKHAGQHMPQRQRVAVRPARPEQFPELRPGMWPLVEGFPGGRETSGASRIRCSGSASAPAPCGFGSARHEVRLRPVAYRAEL